MPQHVRTRRHRSPRDARSRWDVQGLRAFAVLAVIADHLLGWPRGGFVGVDVFFVLSGFLITGLLLREHERTGTISFSGFYRRRVKRIVPAMLLVLVTTLAASWFVFSQARWRVTTVDALWAVLSAANWRFAVQSADYFQADRPVSPFQHYWSLGVEEQFYLVWPWLLLLVFVALRRQGSPRRARVAAGLTIGVISVASFAWALHASAATPERAYFSTFTRTWELGVGALLAVATPLLTRLPARLRPVLAWTGLVGVTASLFVVTPEAGFPAPGAALPVLAAALVVAAGTGVRQQRFLWPLTNRAAGYVGDISYSLYLWHFPVIIVGTLLFGEGLLARCGYAVVLVLAAVYAYHLLEDPVRRSGWLTTPRASRHRSRRSSRTRAWLTRPYKLTALSLVLVADVALVAVAVPSTRNDDTTATAPVVVSAAPEPGDSAAPKQAALTQEIAAALSATSWPALQPSLDTVADDLEPDDIGRCGVDELPEAQCTWGDPSATRTAIMVGDSISMTYVTALRAALGDDSGWRLMSYGGYGCTFIDADLDAQSDKGKDCPGRKERAIEAVNRVKPDVVFVANYPGFRTRLGSSTAMTPVEQEDAYKAELAKLTGAKRIVVLAAPPRDKSVGVCYTRTSKPKDCISQVTPDWTSVVTADRAMAADIKAGYVDSRDWFCLRNQCPSFVAGIPTKKDFVHMTPEYALHVAPVIREALVAQKILELA